MTKDFKAEDALLVLEVGDKRYPLPYEDLPYNKAPFLIVDKDYTSCPVWNGDTGANEWLEAYKEDIPEFLYWELENYSRVWEITSDLSLNVMMSDKEESEVESILSGMYQIDFTEWEKSLATRLAAAVPNIKWGYKVWNEELSKYHTVIIGG